MIDAIDNVTAKLHLLTTCLQAKIPVVSVTGSGGRLDPTQVEVADLSKTKGDPLARVLRKELSRRGFDTSRRVGLPVVFSNEVVMEPIAPGWDAEGFRCICPHAEDSPHACEKRRVIYGTASFVTSTFGMAATSVVIRGLTGNSAD
ncbi:MAG: tRNA A37 threonylcarbamoyladenosine dehydratase [Mariniblastus sp.]